jgi:hypothetical protein
MSSGRRTRFWWGAVGLADLVYLWTIFVLPGHAYEWMAESGATDGLPEDPLDDVRRIVTVAALAMVVSLHGVSFRRSPHPVRRAVHLLWMAGACAICAWKLLRAL